MPRERKSYIIVRRDGLILHTKPVTLYKAEWLHQSAYYSVKDRIARMRYLEEYGNVLDAGKYAERLEQLDLILYYNVRGIYGDPEEFEERVRSLLNRGETSPGARQTLEEFAERVGEFLRRPVEPRPLGPRPVRYYEMNGRHVRPCPCDIALEVAWPKPMWYEYDCGESSCDDSYGISVFKNYLWLWREYEDDDGTYIVVVRRDASDGDVVAAVAGDEVAREFLMENADDFRYLIRETEAELIDKGYGDVARKVKVILATLDLLSAGRREEEGEALPA